MLMRTGTMLEKLALFVALLGGVALVVIALITLVSVTGRTLIPLGFKPLRGQFELVEALTAFAVFAFLPWAHLKRGHASVAIFTDYLGYRVNALIDLLSDGILFAFALLITWRHMAGLADKMAFGETTFLLRMPLWWAYAACLVGLGTWILVSLWATINSAYLLTVPPPVKLTGRAIRK